MALMNETEVTLVVLKLRLELDGAGWGLRKDQPAEEGHTATPKSLWLEIFLYQFSSLVLLPFLMSPIGFMGCYNIFTGQLKSHCIQFTSVPLRHSFLSDTSTLKYKVINYHICRWPLLSKPGKPGAHLPGIWLQMWIMCKKNLKWGSGLQTRELRMPCWLWPQSAKVQEHWRISLLAHECGVFIYSQHFRNIFVFSHKIKVEGKV